jgi:hypothetical protein
MNDDAEGRRLAYQVAAVAAAGLHQITRQLNAEASAIVLLQGGNVAGTVVVPPGLSPDELARWSSMLAAELRNLADDIERGETRAELERQAKAYRAQQA